MKRKLVLCGNGGLLQYVRENSQEDGSVEVVHTIEDINLLSAEKMMETVDSVVLAVSWRETEKWIARIKECHAVKIYRVPVHAMQYQRGVLTMMHNIKTGWWENEFQVNGEFEYTICGT